MSIMDAIFGAKPEATPTAPVAAPAAVPPAQGNIPAAPTVLAEPANPTAPQIPASPLDQFSTLWENDPTKQAEGEVAKPLTAEQIQTAMGKADFTESMDPNLLAAITAGGEDATQALPQILNAMARQVMTQSTLVNNKLTERAVAAAVEQQQAALPALLRQQQATDHLKTSNPLFDNPAIKPVMEAARDQILSKHPNATTAEITTMTHDFVTAMGEAFAPAPVVTKSADDVDWNKYLE